MKEPPGTKADRALWRDAGNLSNQLTSTRWAANGMHWRIRTEELSGRLDTAAKADPAAAARLGELRKKLVGAQTESYADLTGKWPIDPTRGCQYPRSMLGAAMEASATRDNRAQLGQARDAAATVRGPGAEDARPGEAIHRGARPGHRRGRGRPASRSGRRPAGAPREVAMRPGIVLAALAFSFASTAAAEPTCQGRLSGKVTGTFACDVSLTEPGDGEAMFVVQPRGPVPDVPAYAPGAFRVPLPVRTGRFTLDDLGMGKASVAAEGGVLYTATKTTGQRGEVTLAPPRGEARPRPGRAPGSSTGPTARS